MNRVKPIPAGRIAWLDRGTLWLAVILAFATAVMIGVGLSALQWTLSNTYRDAELDSANLALARLDSALELAASHGASLRDSPAPAAALKRTHQLVATGINSKSSVLLLTEPDGSIFASSPEGADTMLRDILSLEANASSLTRASFGEHVTFAELGGYQIISRPISNGEMPVAYLVAALPGVRMPPKALAGGLDILDLSTVLFGFVLTFSLLCYARVRRRLFKVERSERRMLAAICGLSAMICLLGYSLLRASELEEAMGEKRTRVNSMLLELIERDVEETLARGFALENLRFFRFGWGELIAQLDPVERLDIRNGEGRLLYRSNDSSIERNRDDFDGTPQEVESACCFTVRRPVFDARGIISARLAVKLVKQTDPDNQSLLRQAATVESLLEALTPVVAGGIGSDPLIGEMLARWARPFGLIDYIHSIELQRADGAPLFSFYQLTDGSYETQRHDTGLNRALDGPSAMVGRAIVVEPPKDNSGFATGLWLDLTCIVLVLSLLLFEVLLVFELLMARWNRTVATGKKAVTDNGADLAKRTRSSDISIHYSPDVSVAFIRPMIFLLLLAIDLPMSFIPLYAARLFEPVLGLPQSLVLALPLSAEFLFVGVAILLSGFWIDRQGWKRTMVIGALLATLGALLSWSAGGLAMFIFARSVLGVGFGFALMASQAAVVSGSSAKDHARGLAYLFAGIYGGSITGGVGGALLAEYLGFESVFALSALLAFVGLNLIMVLVSLSGYTAAQGQPMAAASQSGAGRFAGVGEFLKDSHVLCLMLLSSLPISILAVGFLNYFGPIYLNDHGASQSLIGQILILYGCAMVFLGPWVNRSIVSLHAKRCSVFFGSLLSGASLLVFLFLDGVQGMLLSVFILGIAHSLALSAQSALMLALPVAQRLGESSALGVFRASARFGQMLGPLVFAGILMQTSIEVALACLAAVNVLAAIGFWFGTRRIGVPERVHGSSSAVDTSGKDTVILEEANLVDCASPDTSVHREGVQVAA